MILLVFPFLSYDVYLFIIDVTMYKCSQITYNSIHILGLKLVLSSDVKDWY